MHKAKNTSNLIFIPLKEKVKITGRFGYCIEDENGVYESYDFTKLDE